MARQREDGEPDAPARPLLNVKLHLWVRELRRMVCSVYEVAEALPTTESGAGPSSDRDDAHSERLEARSDTPLERRGTRTRTDRDARRRPMRSSEVTGGVRVGPVHRIRYADDLKPDEDSVHLPLIQCRECHATGWGCA